LATQTGGLVINVILFLDHIIIILYLLQDRRVQPRNYSGMQVLLSSSSVLF
jgi:hypothetical protein